MEDGTEILREEELWSPGRDSHPSLLVERGYDGHQGINSAVLVGGGPHRCGAIKGLNT